MSLGGGTTTANASTTISSRRKNATMVTELHHQRDPCRGRADNDRTGDGRPGAA
jgi:hypothetical protein